VLSSFGFLGQGTVTLDDVIIPGSGVTDFGFTISDGTSNIIDSVGTAVTVAITVRGPNGNVSFSFNGTVH
jgi:hypothetical protein